MRVRSLKTLQVPEVQSGDEPPCDMIMIYRDLIRIPQHFSRLRDNLALQYVDSPQSEKTIA